MKRLIVVDISSFIFRAFFAIRPMHAPDGVPVNSVYGILSMILKLLNNYQTDHIVLARDLKGGSFRNEIYPEYKANRSEPPEELVPQFALIEELIEKMCIPQSSLENYEADDIIGSIVEQYQDQFDEILIASGDKDLMQFVNEKVKMLDTMKDKIYGPSEVFEKMGVKPGQIRDYLSLLGDTSDNIPGVKGIGAKGAAKLIDEYGDLENIIKNVDHLKNKRAKTALSEGIEMARLSYQLVGIKTDLKLNMLASDFKFKPTAHPELIEFLNRLNFKSMIAKISGNSNNTQDLSYTSLKYEVIKDKTKLDDLLAELNSYDQFFIEPLYLSDNYHDAQANFCSLSFGEKIYILDIKALESFDEIINKLLDLEDILIITNSLRNIAYTAIKLNRSIPSSFDLIQAHFVLDPDRKHDLESMSQEYLYETIPSLKELKKESLESEQSYQTLFSGMAKRAYSGIRVYPWLEKKLRENELYKVYTELDMPLIPILSEMELNGIKLDVKYFKQLEEEFTDKINQIEKDIYQEAGEEVNLKSPKQVSELLFEKLSLPIIKKTKTGASTDSSVLETLAKDYDSLVAKEILKFRELEKLNSTYVKAIPKLVQQDGKIHTHFMQNNAATGRLSSESPNLQNIPIRSENGRKLRRGFIASKDYKLLGADYSQIELRIMAHMSEDPVLMKAFENGDDIHAQTAAQVFAVHLKEVTSDQRSFAKAINFGLMYGQSSFGLSQTLGISRTEAKDYITQYFKKFHHVKSFLDSLKEECERKGYSETLLGRKRIIKDIDSTNRQVKSFAERMAINSPIQGSAADLIKIAMINIDKEIKAKKLKSKMLLQVHDELIFEAHENELDLMESMVREKMQSALLLRVPLKVDLHIAANWYELK